MDLGRPDPDCYMLRYILKLSNYPILISLFWCFSPVSLSPFSDLSLLLTPVTMVTTPLFVGVQQQWAAYYQQLVQMYGEQQAQVYWTQLSQQQAAASKPQ